MLFVPRREVAECRKRGWRAHAFFRRRYTALSCRNRHGVKSFLTPSFQKRRSICYRQLRGGFPSRKSSPEFSPVVFGPRDEHGFSPDLSRAWEHCIPTQVAVFLLLSGELYFLSLTSRPAFRSWPSPDTRAAGVVGSHSHTHAHTLTSSHVAV